MTYGNTEGGPKADQRRTGWTGRVDESTGFYLAGAVSGESWRDEVCSHDDEYECVGGDFQEWGRVSLLAGADWNPVPKGVLGCHRLCGPFVSSKVIGRDHDPLWVGTNFDGSNHGWVDLDIEHGDYPLRADLADQCVAAILAADVVFAYLTAPDCYATIFELGLAYQAGKKIWVAESEQFCRRWRDDFWFALNFASTLGKHKAPVVGGARDSLKTFIHCHNRQVDAESKVYFIEAEGTGRIKIGVSKDPLSRLRTLQTGSPSPLRLIATAFGGYAKEAELHQRFEDARIDGEWFYATAPLLNHIASIKA